MREVIVVSTSYPEHAGDAQGHFVAAEVRRLCRDAHVTVLAPGRDRQPLGTERVVSLGGGVAFGFPGALARLRRAPWRAIAAARFVAAATRWLQQAWPPPQQLVAHFLLPCGAPIATRGLTGDRTDLEVVVHGSDARLFARLPAVARARLGADLARARARLRFVSSELEHLVLSNVTPAQRALLQPHARVEPCAVDVVGVPSRPRARALLGIADDARVAVIVARLVPGKRVDVALEACQRLAHLKTVVIGDGPERARLAARFPRARYQVSKHGHELFVSSPVSAAQTLEQD